jgi:hypothetical protein
MENSITPIFGLLFYSASVKEISEKYLARIPAGKNRGESEYSIFRDY